MSEKKTVLLGITGSIAAYKAAEVASALKKRGVDVVAVMTKAAAEFITPLTLETVTANPVYADMFHRTAAYDVEHISLAKRADVLAVVPATANFIGKLANGIADDLLTTVAMATTAPVLIAPAMNTNMYLSPANQANLELLQKRGCAVVSPGRGKLACGDEGVGRLADVEDVVAQIMAALYPKRDLEGKRIVVTAGPTREQIDPVRFITNRSSGKMGIALAEAARDRGAQVTLVAGAVSASLPQGVDVRRAVSTEDMFRLVSEAFADCDGLIMAAAPADFTPETVFDQKIKKTGEDGLVLKLKKTRDILGELGPHKGGRFVCGFAAETNDVEKYATDKLKRKNLDMIAANDVTQAGAGFGVDTNRVTMYFPDGSRVKSAGTKRQVADDILDQIAKRL